MLAAFQYEPTSRVDNAQTVDYNRLTIPFAHRIADALDLGDGGIGRGSPSASGPLVVLDAVRAHA